MIDRNSYITIINVSLDMTSIKINPSIFKLLHCRVVTQGCYRGKFGVVHKCLDMATNKSCAAKVMKVMKKDKTDVQREIDVMNCLSHPTLVALLDAFEAEQTVVLVME